MSIRTKNAQLRSICNALKIAGLVGFSVALTGCGTFQKTSVPLSEEAQVAEVLRDINDDTKVAVNAQRDLALTVDARVQREMAMRQRILTDTVTYDFYGDVETIVKEIAVKYGYDFEVYGKRPPEGVPINVFIKKRPVLDVLKNIGITATYWLDIKVTAKAIEVRYHDAQNVSVPGTRVAVSGSRKG